jgi:hypothetical protein
LQPRQVPPLLLPPLQKACHVTWSPARRPALSCLALYTPQAGRTLRAGGGGGQKKPGPSPRTRNPAGSHYTRAGFAGGLRPPRPFRNGQGASSQLF